MMKRFALLVLLALVPVTTFAETTQRYIVVTTTPAPQAIRGLRGDDFEPGVHANLRSFVTVNGFAADLTPSEVAELKRSRHVRWVEPVLERHLFADTIVNGQQTTPFGVDMVHARDVWPVTKGMTVGTAKAPVNVAVIDTGIRHTMQELKGIYKGGFNFVNNTDDPMDDNGHGTHVAGIVAAADDGVGVVGVAPAINLWGLKVLNQCGSGTTEATIRAIDWVVTKKSQVGGNWVANLSLGSDDQSAAERIAFQRAADAGVLVFAASGNGYDTNPVDGIAYPAGYSSVISVGAIDSARKVAGFSQRGPGLKMVAPGVETLSTYVTGGVFSSDNRSFMVEEMEAEDSKGDPICFSRPVITGQFVRAGYGRPEDFPAGVAGKIVLIERGLPAGTTTTMTFGEKAKNAKLAGAIGAIIFNNVDGAFSGTLGTLTSASVVPYTVSMSRADAMQLIATPNVSLTLSYGLTGWALLQGTSMSSPHAAGVGALVWAVAPSATAAQVANAMIETAEDLGTTGVDNVYGHGLVNAVAAAKKLNGSAFRSKGEPTKWRSGH